MGAGPTIAPSLPHRECDEVDPDLKFFTWFVFLAVQYWRRWWSRSQPNPCSTHGVWAHQRHQVHGHVVVCTIKIIHTMSLFHNNLTFMDDDKEDVSGNVAKLGKVVSKGGERVTFEVWEGQSLARFGFLIDQKKKGLIGLKTS